MATTTNYSWTTPDDTALVKDGASAIRTLGSAIDTTTKNLNPSTTLGDIEYRSSTANTNTRLGIGTTGQVLTVSGGVPAWTTLVTGTTWTQRLAATGTQFNKVAYNGSNLYVAVGNSGQLYSSTNGTTWTSRTSGFGANAINDVFFGNSLWVAVGVNGTITTSTDGTTWTARTSNMSTNAINAVIYANSLWVAVGEGGGTTNTGGITYSTDGLTWTRKSQSLTVGTSYNDVIWNGTNWIVGAANSTNNYLYATAPSGTWTAGSDGSGATIQQILWDGTRHLVGATLNQVFRYSTSTTLGTTTAYTFSPTFPGRRYCYYYNGKVYVGWYWIQAFTPTTAILPTMETMMFNPLTYVNSAAAYGYDLPTFSLWIGASGYILADQYGRIYTSF